MKKGKGYISLVLVVALFMTQMAWPQAAVKAAAANLALGKIVTASQEYIDPQWGQPKENAVDGNPDTAWSAASAVNPTHWLKVDLGSEFDLSGVEITWKDDEIVKYIVEVSPDDMNWTIAAENPLMRQSSRRQALLSRRTACVMCASRFPFMREAAGGRVLKN